MSGSIRSSIMKAMARGQRQTLASESNVVNFPGQAAKKVRKRVKKPKRYKKITQWDDRFRGQASKKTAPDYFQKETINGKPYMRRDDGALFKLNNDGSWSLTKEPRKTAKAKKSMLPYIGAGAAIGLGGAVAYDQFRKK